MVQAENNQSCEKLAKHNFKSFLLKVFQTTSPNTQFVDGWHIDLLVEYLYKVEQGKIKRLLINIPPRSLKSTIISVAWPAWLLGQDPSRRIIVASYAQRLSLKHSLECKLIITSGWYREQFPKTQILRGSNEKNKFTTDEQGFRFATSIGGTLTGEGADVLIVDDPHTPLQAASRAERYRAMEWYDRTLSTRLNDKRKGVIVVLMQRLNQEDLSGHLLKKKVWKHLKLAAYAEKDITYRCGKFCYKRKKGELLLPARESTKELERAKLELGSYGFNAQYQQDPVPLSSGIIKHSWVVRFEHMSRSIELCYQSWDCAIKAGCHNDYSVCTTWSVTGNKYYLQHVLREQLEFPQLKNKVLELYQKYQPAAVLIEDKASGQPLIQELREQTTIPVIKINPCKDKETRLLSTVGLFESGRVYFPKNQHWLADLEAELFTFPHSSHDDQVDSITQFLGWIKNHNLETRVLSRL